MIKSVLVPIDGSEASKSAIDYAIHFAKQCDVTLEGLGIVDVPTIQSGQSAPVGGASFKQERDATLIKDARSKVSDFLSEFDASCRAGGVTHTSLSVDGLPYEVINQRARLHDMIIIGRDTCFHFETTDRPDETLGRLVRDSSRPVCAVPPEVNDGRGTVVAVDDSTASARTAQLFGQFGLFRDQPTHVLAIDSSEDEAKLRCEATGTYLELHGYTVTRSPVASRESASSLIVQHTESVGAGMIVIGAHDGQRIHDFFFGSTTSKVLAGTRAAVFIHH